jgi:hypothetical protein
VAGNQSGLLRARVRRRLARARRVPSWEAPLLAAATLASPDPMSRLRRQVTVPQRLYGRTAQGNSTLTSDPRGQRAAQPGKGPGAPLVNASPWPRRLIVTAPSQLLRTARTPGYQHGRLTARDRHIAAYRGRTTSSSAQQRTGGLPNPEADGPARPAYQMINRTLSWQAGADHAAFLDNPLPKPVTTAGPGRAFPLGTQGQPWTLIYGGTRNLALHRPYGFRGGPRGGPGPRTVALPGGPHRPGKLLAEGDPADGPQKVFSGPPWGLHSPTVPPVKLTQGSERFRFHQVRPPRVNRPQNSRAEGQSWNQAVVHLDGSAAVKLPRAAPGRQPGLNQRFLPARGSSR